MWFLGLIIGAGFGAVFGHFSEGALLGLVVGLLAGKKPGRDGPAEERVRALEARIVQLESAGAWLEARIRQLEGGGPAAEVLSGPSAAEAATGSFAAVPDGAGDASSDSAVPGVAAAPGTASERTDSGAIPSAPPAFQPFPPAPIQPLPAEKSRWAEIEDSPAWNRAEAEDRDALSAFWQRLLSGNLLAKIGVALLFFGVASALKLAAEHGWFPPPLRLLLGSLAGGGMVWFGWGRREDEAHRIFGQVLQGGGFGLLYLMVYFALAWYGLIGHGFAFVLFALLGLGCTLLALAEEAPTLAVFGLAGAFLAPLLAASGDGSHVVLFSYYLLLNGFILALAWLRDWRALTATGFLFTFVVGMGWALRGYRPEFYGSTQLFLVLFFLLYSATPSVFALLRAPGRAAWHEALLLFGTPVAGILLQAPLVADAEYGLAWSACLAGLYYLGLWRAVAGREAPEFELLRLAQFGIGLGLLTLAVPLAFGAAATVAIWSVEGAATLWLSLRLARPFGQWFGLLAQVGAGFWLLLHVPELAEPHAFTNGIFTGGLLVALAGLASAAMLKAYGRDAGPLPADALLVWGLAWWYGSWLHEIGEFARPGLRPGLGLLLFAGTGLGGELLGHRFRWPLLRDAAILVLPAAAVAVLVKLDGPGEILRGLTGAALPLALAVHYFGLRRRDGDPGAAGPLRGALHMGAAWLAVTVLTHDAAVLADRWGAGRSLWPTLALGLVPAALLGHSTWGIRRQWWPWNAAQGLYARGLALPLAILLAGWFCWASFAEPGGLGRYLPLLDPLDLGLLAVLATVRGVSKLDAAPPAWGGRLLLLLAFLGFSGLAARLAHHWGGVPFTPWDLLDSALLQALLSIFWTVLSIALMISGARTCARDRWFAGFGLLALVGGKLLLVDLIHSGTLTWTASLIGIALLVLAAAYFAPMPPKAGAGGRRSVP